MKHLTRSTLRRAAAEYPVGSAELGFFDPVTAIGVSSGISTIGQLAGMEAQDDATNQAKQAENRRLRQLAPYREAGTSALPQYQEAIGTQPTYAGVVAGMANDPGYQFELQQGTNAVQGSAAARGLLRSGRTLKDLTSYAQGLAAARAGDAFTRELGAFNNKQNQLFNLAQLGANAAGAPSNLAQLALQQGQNRADAFTNLGNIGTNAAGNLFLANYLQQRGGGLSGGVAGSGLSANSIMGGLA